MKRLSYFCRGRQRPTTTPLVFLLVSRASPSDARFPVLVGTPPVRLIAWVGRSAITQIGSYLLARRSALTPSTRAPMAIKVATDQVAHKVTQMGKTGPENIPGWFLPRADAFRVLRNGLICGTSCAAMASAHPPIGAGRGGRP